MVEGGSGGTGGSTHFCGTRTTRSNSCIRRIHKISFESMIEHPIAPVGAFNFSKSVAVRSGLRSALMITRKDLSRTRNSYLRLDGRGLNSGVNCSVWVFARSVSDMFDPCGAYVSALSDSSSLFSGSLCTARVGLVQPVSEESSTFTTGCVGSARSGVSSDGFSTIRVGSVRSVQGGVESDEVTGSAWSGFSTTRIDLVRPVPGIGGPS